jgi:hypothetical protein
MRLERAQGSESGLVARPAPRYGRPVRRRLAALAPLAAALAALLPAPAEAQLSTQTFRTPSRNIGCVFAPARGGERATLRCDILSGLRPTPARRCRLDWVGLVLGGRGRANPLCAGDTAADPGSRILAYGRAWRRGPFRCVSRRTGLRCRNADSRGFVLARRGWRRL